MPEPRGAEPGFRRLIVVVQGDAFNRSRITTILRVAITSNLQLADAPGNVLLLVNASGLPKDSAANISQVNPLDRKFLTQRVSSLHADLVRVILDGILLALGL